MKEAAGAAAAAGSQPGFGATPPAAPPGIVATLSSRFEPDPKKQAVGTQLKRKNQEQVEAAGSMAAMEAVVAQLQLQMEGMHRQHLELRQETEAFAAEMRTQHQELRTETGRFAEQIQQQHNSVASQMEANHAQLLSLLMAMKPSEQTSR